MTLEELRSDLKVVENKFAETGKIALIAAKYGLKAAGRTKMSSEVTQLILEKIRAIRSRTS
jgi:hypothetical protein